MSVDGGDGGHGTSFQHGDTETRSFWFLFLRFSSSYRDYLTDIDGTPTQLAGNRQVLTPSVRVGGGLLYVPERGWRGSVTSNWIGDHWLNSLNTFDAPAYAVVDASLGYRFQRFTVSVLGSNLRNRRDAVQLSELGEGQFYRMPNRRVDATLTWHYK